jgi:hypothetical protein
VYTHKCEAPWLAPPANDSDATVFHDKPIDNAAPQISQLSGTINLGFSVSEDKRNKMKLSLLLKCFMSFTKQTYADFCIEPLNGGDQSITNPSNIPTTKEGDELYFQHRIVPGGIMGEINVAMLKTMGDMKDLATPLRKYLKKEKVSVSQASIDADYQCYSSNRSAFDLSR